MNIAFLSWLEGTILQQSLWYPGTYTIFLPFLVQFSLSLQYGGCVLDISFGAVVFQLWLSLTVSICCKDKHPWWGIRAIILCEYKEEHLENSWELNWFRWQLWSWNRTWLTGFNCQFTDLYPWNNYQYWERILIL